MRNLLGSSVLTGRALRATGLYFFFCAANIGIAGTGYGVWIAGGDAIEREGIGEETEGTIGEGIAETRGETEIAEGIASEVAGEIADAVAVAVAVAVGSLEVAEIAGNAVDAEGYPEEVDAVETRFAGAEITGTIDRVREVAVEVAGEIAGEIADADTDADAGR